MFSYLVTPVLDVIMTKNDKNGRLHIIIDVSTLPHGRCYERRVKMHIKVHIVMISTFVELHLDLG